MEDGSKLKGQMSLFFIQVVLNVGLRVSLFALLGCISCTVNVGTCIWCKSSTLTQQISCRARRPPNKPLNLP